MASSLLKPIVSQLREAIIKGVSGKLEKYGFDENGNIHVDKPLSEYDEKIKNNLKAYFDAKGIDNKDKYVDYIHNTSRTFLHILICFKLMEKRGIMCSLLERVINTNIYNEIVPDFSNINSLAYDDFVEQYESEILKLSAEDNNEETEEYYQFIFLMQKLSREMAKEVPLLFKEFEFNIVQPDFDDIKIILSIISRITDDEYDKDDFLGWIYQYWVDTDDNEIELAKNDRDVSYSNELYYAVLELLDKEQTEYGEFYTPRWVVKYIVDNLLDEYCSKNKKNIEEIKLLDPACGAGNFLVYTFDALFNRYKIEHADWDNKRIVESIFEKNIYGTDIQREPLQITALNLWIKAKSYAVSANISSLNLYNVNILRANSLYKWESEEEYHQMSLFDDIDNLDEKKYTSEDIGRLLSNQDYITHNSAVKFFRNKFEIVIMNPPFVDTRKMNNETKEFLSEYYPDNSRNLFSAFIQRAFELTAKEGIIGFVSSDTWMAIGSFEKIRNLILDNSLIKKCLHLGFGVFDGADVSGVVFLLDKQKNARQDSIFIDVRDIEDKTEENGVSYSFNQKTFRNIEGTPFIYELKSGLRKAFEKSKSLGNGEIADVYSGLQVKMDNGYVFKKWDVSEDNKYVKFAYDCVGKYYSELNYVIDWSDNSVDRLKKESKEKGYHHSVLISGNADKYLFRDGILYSAGGSRFYSRIMDSNTIFYVGESAVFINDDSIEKEYVLGLMNSRFADYILNLLNPSKNFQVGDISRIPFVYPTAEAMKSVTNKTKKLIELQKRIYSFEYTSVQYEIDEIGFGFKRGAKSIKEAYDIYEKEYHRIMSEMEKTQDEVDELIFEVYSLNSDEKQFILDRFNNNVNQFNKPITIEEAVLRYIKNLVKNHIKDSMRLYTEDDILKIIQGYFDSKFEKNGYAILEEAEEIIQRKTIEVIKNGIKVGSKNIVFSGEEDSMDEPLLLSKKLFGRGNKKVSVYWFRSDFLLALGEGKRYALQNEIRRVTTEDYSSKLQRAKEKLVGFYGKKSELKELEKEVSVLEECIKTLDNWKVVD